MEAFKTVKSFWLVILATIIATIAQYFYKTGADKFPVISWQIPIAVLCMFAVAGLMLLALRNAELSYAYPILATSFIWVGLVGYFILGEAMSAVNWAGLALIFIGVAMIK
ncbi:EamA family transporter [Candidatus Woesearchaeota archaeon]|nr:EamA family transporter [Candidatus Woesearchaeota archaeon]